MSFDLVSKYFPKPKFLEPLNIGISFSDSSIKAVFFDKSLTNPSPMSVVVPLKVGAIVSGIINDPLPVVEALKEIRGKFNTPFVVFTLPDELTYVFLTTIPIGSSNDLRESVAFTIEENVPLSLSDTVFDFIPAKINHTDNGYSALLVVTACVKKELDKFIEVLKEAKFEVLGCIHESQATSLSLIDKGFVGATCIVQARANRVGIYLSRAGIIHFVTIRSVNEGDYAKQFLDEYDKFIEYCSKYGVDEELSIKQTIVCGNFEYAKKVVEALATTSSGVEVKLGNVWTNVLSIDKGTPQVSYEDSLSLAGPVGALLNGLS